VGARSGGVPAGESAHGGRHRSENARSALSVALAPWRRNMAPAPRALLIISSFTKSGVNVSRAACGSKCDGARAWLFDAGVAGSAAWRGGRSCEHAVLFVPEVSSRVLAAWWRRGGVTALVQMPHISRYRLWQTWRVLYLGIPGAAAYLCLNKGGTAQRRDRGVAAASADGRLPLGGAISIAQHRASR